MSNTLSSKKAGKRHNNLALQGLMRLVNSVPADVKLPELKTNWKEVIALLKSKDFKAYRKLTGSIRRRRFLPRVLVPDGPLTFTRVIGQYETLRLGRQWLQSIATIGENLRRWPELQSGRMKWSPPSVPQRSVTMYTDEEGLLRFILFPVLAALEGIRVVTLRNCPVCKKFFLARRKDQPCCSPKCAHILRTKRWREEYPQSYKLKRIGTSERKAPAS